MTTPPTPPSPGKPVSAGFFTRLIGWVKSGMIVEGQGYRLRRGPNGTVLDIEKTAAPKSSRIPGLFEPKMEIDDNGDGKVVFTYPYYMVGTRLYRCEDKDVELQAEKGIYCLVVDLSAAEPKGTIEIYEDFGEVQEAALIPTDSIKPLFEFGDKGTPIRDFRNMPTVSSQEFDV